MVRRLPEIVVAVAALLTVVACCTLIGAAANDRAITRSPGIAQAEVLDGSSSGRALVRFRTATGETVVPEHGVFYPRGLRVGDSVAVEYAVDDPDLVRVAGRSFVDGLPALAAAVLIGWLLLTPLALWLRRRRRRLTR